ncbi:MAG TPA: recombinase family protein [Solirubrobacteraceae bacterium]|nr:recombinase family protein [Solirubrobacteraceae bacterium]
MALIGYARVSVLEEETWHQHDVLEEAGCARIFTDRSSGAHEERPELARCFDHLREGDTLVIARLDRLGRSLRDLVDTTLALGERGIALRSLDEAIDTSGPDGPTVLLICEALAAFELELVRERTALAAAGIREPRLSALVEAARSRPSRRSAAAAAAEAAPGDAPPVDAADEELGMTEAFTPVFQESDAAPAPAPSPRRSRRRRAQPSPAAPARPPRSSARRRALIAAQVGVSMAAAVAAFQVSRSGASTVTVALTHTTANGDVELRHPDGWRRTSADLAVGALRLDDAIVLAQGRTGNSTLMAGLSPATGATLLPAEVRRRLDGTLRPTRVRLGGRVAERYADLRLRGLARHMTVFVVPTTEGALTLACLARPREVAALRDVCERVAQSMVPTRGRAIALGPSARYQAQLNQVVGGLDATRVDRRTKLASAHTARRQAHLAEELSSAYADARAAGARARVSPRESAAHRRILAALGDTSGAYERLAATARAERPSAYDSARSAVAFGERRVRAALAALARLGYEVATARSFRGS